MMLPPRSRTPGAAPLPPLPPHAGLWASVVLINYNCRAFIRRCLESLLASDYPWFEVILVDNGSTDDSLSLIADLAGRLTIIRNPRNDLSSGGLNHGIRQARGEVIVLLDLDTEVRPDWLRKLLDPLALDPRIAVTGCKLLYPDGETIQHAGGAWERNAMCRHFGIGEKDRGQWDQPRDVDYVTGAAFAIRRSFFEQVGGLIDELFPFYYEETDICWHARRLGYRVAYVPDAVAIHHESASMVRDSPRYLFNYHRSRCRFILKNYPWKTILGRMLLEEARWLAGVVLAHGYWRIMPKCYLAALAALPAVLRRRLARRALLKRLERPQMRGCVMCDALFLRPNGDMPCWCDGGKYHALFSVTEGLLQQAGFDVANHEALRGIRTSFQAGRTPFGDSCGKCAMSRALSGSEAASRRTELKLVHVEPSARCPLQCLDCEKLSATPHLLPLPLFRAFLANLRRSGVRRIGHLLFEGFGEPLLNPDLPEMIRAAKQAYPETVVILSTSGNLPFSERLAEAPVDHLKVSIDGVAPEAYARYRRGGSFAKAWEFLQAAARNRERRGTPRHIEWKYILFEWNDSDEEIRAAARMAEGLGVQLSFDLSCNPANRTRRLDAGALELKLRDLAPGATNIRAELAAKK